jgi:hypothetical protein
MRQIFHDLEPTCYPVTHNNTILLLKDLGILFQKLWKKETLQKKVPRHDELSLLRVLSIIIT